MLIKLKGVIIVAIIYVASVMMPFNIYADSITSDNIVGINVELMDTSNLDSYDRTVSGGTVTYYYNMYTYQINVQLDDYYIGYINLRYQGTYNHILTSSGATTSTSFNIQRNLYVNGNTVSFTHSFNCYAGAFVDPLQRNSDGSSPYITLIDSDLTKYEDINSIQQILDILNNLYNSVDNIEGLQTNQLAELENIVSNTSLANSYLDTLSKMRQWNIPIESFGFINYSLHNYSNYLYSIQNLYYYQFPIYRINSGITLYEIWLSANRTYDLIFIDDINTSSQAVFFQHYSLDGVSINSYNALSISKNTKLIHVTFTTNSSAWIYFKSLYSYNYNFVPIYFNESNYKNISTDFAINFGLRNELLDNLNIIANGTTSSNQANTDLDSASSQFTQQSDNVIGVEENLTNNFESKVQNIDINTGLSGFGGNFMTSATWVRTQFDRLTNSNPYGSLVTFGLTLGFALLMLGKVLL